MKVTKYVRDILPERRFRKRMLADGYEEIMESGHPLWMFVRGSRTREKIIDTKVSPLGNSVWIKTDGGKQWADEQAAMLASWKAADAALSPSGV